jgi:hypothetical protein
MRAANEELEQIMAQDPSINVAIDYISDEEQPYIEMEIAQVPLLGEDNVDGDESNMGGGGGGGDNRSSSSSSSSSSGNVLIPGVDTSSLSSNSSRKKESALDAKKGKNRELIVMLEE